MGNTNIVLSPGFISKPRVSYYDAREIINGTLSDLEDLNIDYKESSLEENNLDNHYKIGIMVSNFTLEDDSLTFHYIREYDNIWSEQQGLGGQLQEVNPNYNNYYHLVKVLQVKKY